jgi:hypothetical protein
MKKLLLVMAVAGFVACNNKTEEKETTEDTTVTQPEPQPTTVDTTMTVTPMDTSAVQK